MRELDIGDTQERSARTGSLEVISGCMFSGKTDELIRRLRRAKIAREQIQAFKPSIDTRYGGSDKLNSHSGQEWEGTVPIGRGNPMDILDKVEWGTSVVGIDEAQFFAKGIVETCNGLIARRIRVIVAGLGTDFRDEPFGQMPQLMALAEKVDNYHAICQVCKKEASFTQRIVDGKPAKYTDPVIVVGASELYEARCRKHHEVPGRPENLEMEMAGTPTHGHGFRQERSRRASILRANLVRWNEEWIAGKLIRNFVKEKDFMVLARGVVMRHQEMIGIYKQDLSAFPIIITDVLSREWPEGNDIIVEGSARLGVEPQSNFTGVRLQATSCLNQLLARQDANELLSR